MQENKSGRFFWTQCIVKIVWTVERVNSSFDANQQNAVYTCIECAKDEDS